MLLPKFDVRCDGFSEIELVQLCSHSESLNKEVDMLAYMYHALSTFRSVFSRHRTWVDILKLPTYVLTPLRAPALPAGPPYQSLR